MGENNRVVGDTGQRLVDAVGDHGGECALWVAFATLVAFKFVTVVRHGQGGECADLDTTILVYVTVL